MVGPVPELKVRKQPRQGRAKATVHAILQAAARILVEQGYEAMTTNRIAKVAGVSIGSLYQYFPTKQAVVIAVSRQLAEEQIAFLQRVVEETAEAPVAVAVQRFVRGFLEVYAIRPQLYHALAAPTLQFDVEGIRRRKAVAQSVLIGYLERHREEIVPQDLGAAAVLLGATVEGTAQLSALAFGRPVATERLEQEMVAMILRYLLGDKAPSR